MSELKFSSNAVFKRVMRNKSLCADLLSILLDQPVTDIEFLETEHEVHDDVESKEIRLDCFSITVDGKIYDVEMQMGDEKDLSRRMRAYQSIIDRDALKKDFDGKTLKYRDIPDVYIIFICTNHPFKNLTSKHICKRTIAPACKEDPMLDCSCGATWIVFDAKMYKEAETQPLRSFLKYVLKGEVQQEDGFLTRLNDEVLRFTSGNEGRMLLNSNVEAHTNGFYKGEEVGDLKGQNKLALLIKILKANGLQDEADAVLDDVPLRKQLMEQYGIK